MTGYKTTLRRSARALALALLATVPLLVLAQEPVRGGHLIAGWPRPLATLDGHKGVAGDEHIYQWLIFDQLIRFNQSGQPVPGLAESWEYTDPTTLVLHLREGVTFHDGTPFNAEAVKFNIERVLNPETASAARAEMEVVTEVNVLDEFTVELKLSSPASDLLLQLSDRAGMMASPAAVQQHGEDFSRFAVGAGPYRVEEFVPGELLVLQRYEDFWEEGAPYLDRITFRAYPTIETALLALESGEIHLVTEVPARNVAAIRNNPNLVYLDWPTERYLQFNINRTKPPLDNVLVRRALAHAVNRDRVNQVVLGGDGVPLDHGIFPEGHWAYCPDVTNWDYDVEEARRLLAEAGYPDGIELEVSTQATDVNIRMLEVVQATAGPEGFQAFFVDNQMNLRTGWWGGRPDPSATLFINFHGGGSQNAPLPSGGYSDPELERLIEAGRQTSDFEERRRIYCEAQRIIIEDVQVLAFAHMPWAIAVSADVQGLEPQLLAKPLLRTVWLNQE